jgi:hypothetical protein
MVAVRVYVEGGGPSHGDQEPLRQGFRKLFEKVLGGRAKPKITACGGRAEAFADFKRGLKSNPDALCVLLVDSEGPVRDGAASWDHVHERKGDEWVRPEGTSEDQIHLMVQAMEAWLIADPDALETYYGQGFRRAALPGQKNVEQISKKDLSAALERATRDSKTKGAYRKSHGFQLIGMIDPQKVRAASWHAARFFDALADHSTDGTSARWPPRR